jgi:hypothetical protein
VNVGADTFGIGFDLRGDERKVDHSYCKPSTTNPAWPDSGHTWIYVA